MSDADVRKYWQLKNQLKPLENEIVSYQQKMNGSEVGYQMSHKLEAGAWERLSFVRLSGCESPSTPGNVNTFLP